ncbi:MAG: GtrA family protein [Chloroflexota bacterium]|nr:GtrA family protein [Chloroflexota bacterium]
MLSVARVARYVCAGSGSLALDLALQALAIQLAGLPVWLASGLSYEIALLVHFFVNDRWVFGQRHSSWRRLAAFQLASLTAMGVTYVVTNLLVYGPPAPWFADGVGPYVAKVIGTGIAAVWTFVSSFFWIWRTRPVDQSIQRSRVLSELS